MRPQPIPTFCSIDILLVTLTFVSAIKECPEHGSSWESSPDCRSYHYCIGGRRASPYYYCSHRELFSTDRVQCMPEEDMDCNSDSESSSLHDRTYIKTTRKPTQRARDKTRPLYFVDVPSSRCVSTLEANLPEWMNSGSVHPYKAECCTVNFGVSIILITLAIIERHYLI